jgi:nitrite reductase (NADH) small subunit
MWLDVCEPEQIAPRSARVVQTTQGPVAVFRTGQNQYFALLDRCPHKGGPLSQGIVHGKGVACPLHNWTISLETGEPLGADAGKGCAPRFAVKVEAGRVLLQLPQPLAQAAE